jgi:hypothetical protein
MWLMPLSPGRGFVAFLVVVATLLTPRPGHAWGRQGHRIVARIAAKNLLQTTREKLRAILGVSNAGLENAMANASIWPDLIDRVATGTERWHFINVPISSPFSVAGLCTAGECVIAQIENMQNRLQNNLTGFTLQAPPHPPRTMTSQQLAFLIHFVGDIHQPLHAVVNGDRGGNCVGLTKPLAHAGTTIPDTTNLHSAWDIDEVLAAMKTHNSSEAATATVLFQRFKNGAAVTQATPTDWARESSDLARSLVYQTLKIPNHSAAPGKCANGIKPVSITTTYLNNNIAAVEQRLMQAGIRLSSILNEICKGTGCKAKP